MKYGLGICFGLAIVFFLSISFPKFVQNYQLSKMQNIVVEVGDNAMQSHGTGFYVKGASGKKYILTNGHVCELATKGHIYSKQVGNSPIAKHVVAISPQTDLCLIDETDNVDTVTLANSYNSLESGEIFGFPEYYGYTSQTGKVLYSAYTQVLWFLIGNEEQEQKCSPAPKFTVEQIELPFVGVIFRVCVLSVFAVNTSIQTLPGNSGSPVLNQWGNVIGIIFAANDRSNWGIMIPVEDIRNFLKDY